MLMALVLLAGVGFTARANHGSDGGSECYDEAGCERTSLKAVAKDIRSYKAKLGELDRILFDMNHEIYEIQIKIQECRVMIRPDDDEILCKQLILDAIDIKETILHIKFEDLGELIPTMIELEGRMLGTTEALIEAGDCSEDLCTKLIRKLHGIEKLLLEIGDILEAQKDRLEDGDLDEEECEEPGQNCFDDLDDWLELAHDTITSDPLATKFLLGGAYAKARLFHRVNRTIFRKKKEMFNRIAEVQTLLKNGLATDSYCGSCSNWRDLASNSKTLQVQLLSASGQTVLANRTIGSAHPLTLRALALNEGLANGVYFAVVTERMTNGQTRQSLERLVVQR
jgi:hypothetical protein